MFSSTKHVIKPSETPGVYHVLLIKQSRIVYRGGLDKSRLPNGDGTLYHDTGGVKACGKWKHGKFTFGTVFSESGQLERSLE